MRTFTNLQLVVCIVMWELISHHQTIPFNKSLSNFISALIHIHIQTQNTLSLVGCWKKKKKKWPTHPCNGHVFTHSSQLTHQQKCCTFSSYKHTNKVLHISFLQTTPTKYFTFSFYKDTPNNLKKVTCAIMAKVKSHLVTLDWQIKKSFPKKI
jgi:hypothetical protein